MWSKGQGLVASAVIADGILLRPMGSIAPKQGELTKAGAVAIPPTTSNAGEGPWIASCKYWAPVRGPEKQLPSAPSEPDNASDLKKGRIDLHVHVDETSSKGDPGCGADPLKRWGFPARGGPVNVTAIVATVPDPVHSHLALTFDRSVDAILQAAADNGYVSSYSWLPWKNRSGVLGTAESPGDVEVGHDPER